VAGYEKLEETEGGYGGPGEFWLVSINPDELFGTDYEVDIHEWNEPCEIAPGFLYLHCKLDLAETYLGTVVAGGWGFQTQEAPNDQVCLEGYAANSDEGLF